MKKYPAPIAAPDPAPVPVPEPTKESTHLAELTGAVLSVVREQYATQDRLANLIMKLQPGGTVRVKILRDKLTENMTELIITRE